ncbi:MAG: WD40 repeat domain-containing protein [Gemmataceae bacterium]
MPPTRLTKLKTYHIDDGAKRGPMTMSQVRFHPTERFLYAATADRRVAMWNLDDKELTVKNLTAVTGKLVCPHDAGWVRCLDVSSDGKWLATGGSDRRLKLWPFAGGKPADNPTHDTEAHAGWVEGLAFSPDGKFLVTGGADLAVRVWNAADLTPVKSLTGHTGFLRDVAWLPDGSAFVTGAEDGKLLVWDAKALSLVRMITFGGANEQFGQNPSLSGVHRLHVSRDGKFLAAAGGKTLTVFDLATGTPVAEDKSDAQVCFSPKDDLLAAGSNNAKVVAYDSTRFVPAKADKNGKLGNPGAIPGKELAQIKLGDFSLGMRFSADGKLLGLGRADGKVEVWEGV